MGNGQIFLPVGKKEEMILFSWGTLVSRISCLVVPLHIHHECFGGQQGDAAESGGGVSSERDFICPIVNRIRADPPYRNQEGHGKDAPRAERSRYSSFVGFM